MGPGQRWGRGAPPRATCIPNRLFWTLLRMYTYTSCCQHLFGAMCGGPECLACMGAVGLDRTAPAVRLFPVTRCCFGALCVCAVLLAPCTLKEMRCLCKPVRLLVRPLSV